MNDAAPDPQKVSTPDAPFLLTEKALEIWLSMCEKLERIGVLAETDLLALARYCDIHARWLKLRDFLDKENYTYQIITESGSTYWAPRPEVSLFNKWIPILSKSEQEFGLTPASRTRIRVELSPGNKDKERRKLYGNT